MSSMSPSRFRIATPSWPENTSRFIEDALDVVSPGRRHGWIHLGLDAQGVREALGVYDQSLKKIDEALVDSPWLAGETFSLAYIDALPCVNRLHVLNMDEIWQKKLLNVVSWFDRIRARASYYPGIEEHLPAESRDGLLRNGMAAGPQLLAACGLN
jgi:glutathione S-transferase